MEAAYPPRFWWLKRLGPLAVTLVALMVGSYWGLGVWADRRIERELAEWRKLPVVQPGDTGGTSADLMDPENPAFHMTNAFTGLALFTAAQREWDNQDWHWPPLNAQDVAMIRGIEAAEAKQFEAVRQAREAAQKHEYRWALGPLSINTMLPHLNVMRALGNRFSWSILLAHHDGDLPRALDFGRDQRELSSGAAKYGPCLISSLVGCGIDAMMHNRLLLIAGHHPPHRTREEELGLWREARPHVQAMIAQLVDTSHYDRLDSAYDGEWLFPLSLRTAPLAMGLPPRNRLTAPALDANTADALAVNRALYHALREHHSYPKRLSAVRGARKHGTVRSVAGLAARRAYSGVMDYDPEHPLRSFARTRLGGYMAAIALASRLFEADHGRLPESLEELVPEYLPRIPEDPFDPEGKPLRYRVDGGVPLVWSVGVNGSDEGGQPATRASYDSYLHEGKDYVLPLRFPAHMDYKPLRWLLKRDGLLEDEPNE